MSKPGSKRLETHHVSTHQCDGSYGRVIDVDYVRLLNDGRLVNDPGGVRLTLSDVDGVKDGTIEPEEALRLADGIRDAANLALAARKHGVVPDVVPAEWTGESPV
jgi:hypothetical protein